MTVPANDRVNQETAVGGETSFGYDFKIFAEADLVVERQTGTAAPVLLINGTDYTVTGVGVLAGGTIELDPVLYPSGAVAGDVYTMYADTQIIRASDYQTDGDFRAVTVNAEFDDIYHILQETDTSIIDSVRRPRTSTEVYPLDWPDGATTDSQVVFVTTEGISLGLLADLGEDVVVSPFMETVLDDTTAAAARTTLGAMGSDFSGLTAVTLAAGDIIPVNDIDDSNTLKRTTAQAVVDLAQDITGLTTVTAAVGDLIAINDASDGNNVKKVTVQTIIDLASGSGAPDTALFTHEEASGTGGGSTASGTTFKTLPLNTEKFNGITGASRQGDQVRLPEGTYRVTATHEFSATNYSQIQLYNDDDAAVIAVGQQTLISGSTSGWCYVQAVFTLDATHDIEYQYRTSTATATTGLGSNSNAHTNTYGWLFVEKIA